VVWASPRSLATTRGIHLYSSPYLDVSVRAVPSTVPMDSARGATPYRVAGCPIRRSSDHGLVPAPRRLSQLPTSFFGTRRQGIHRMLVLPSSSVPRLTKQPFLIAWMRIRSLHHVPCANSVKSHATLQHRMSSFLNRVCRPPSALPQSMSSSLVRGLVVMSLQLLRCTSSAHSSRHRKRRGHECCLIPRQWCTHTREVGQQAAC
jgi:hypothetical protein